MKKKVLKKEILTPWVRERRKRVSANLKRLRKAKDITQEELAEAIGMERSYIGRLETENAPFGSEMEERYASFFGVTDVSEFYKIPTLLPSDAERLLAIYQKMSSEQKTDLLFYALERSASQEKQDEKLREAIRLTQSHDPGPVVIKSARKKR